MLCPNCKHPLEPFSTPSGLQPHACSSCRGCWLSFAEHLRWSESLPPHPATPPPAPDLSSVVPVADKNKARLCPQCSKILPRFRIALDLPFQLERCSLCAGVWFDQGEWASVESRALLPRLHHLFNDTHQHRLRELEKQCHYEERCRELLGDADFQRVRDFKLWLDKHPARATAVAFINDHEVP